MLSDCSLQQTWRASFASLATSLAPTKERGSTVIYGEFAGWYLKTNYPGHHISAFPHRGQYADNDQTFQVKLCNAPCAEPLCWISSMACFPCAQYQLRHKVLNHVEPGSGWSNYKCCQGMFGGCLCIQVSGRLDTSKELFCFSSHETVKFITNYSGLAT